MANIFEELMVRNTRLTESADRRNSRKKTNESKKIKCNKIKLESRFFLEDVDIDDVDAKFEVGPDDVEEKEDEVVLVIDPEIGQNEEIPEDAAEEMVGDYVYKCPVCGANYVCGHDAVETEAIEVDEEGVPTECPICGDDADQILIGEIAPVEDVENPEDNAEMDSVEAEDEDEGSEEVEDETEEETEDEVIEDSLKNRRLSRRIPESKKKTIKESDTVGQNVDEFQKWVDYDMKKYGKISGITKGKLAKAGLEVVKDDHGDYEVIAKSFKHEEEACSPKKESKVFDRNLAKKKSFKTEKEEACGSKSKNLPKKDMKEDINFDEVDVTDFEEGTPEKNAPCKPKINATFTIDEIRLESLLNKMIRENYKGTPKVKLTKAQANGSKLKLEYIVFNGKSKIRGILMAEGFNPKARKMTLKMKDRGAFTESYTKTPAFVVECVVVRNKVIPTTMKYNFTKKINESLYRVVGSVNEK